MPPQDNPTGQTNPSLSPFDRPTSAASITSNPKPPIPTPTPSTQTSSTAPKNTAAASTTKPGETTSGGPTRRVNPFSYRGVAWSPYQWDRKVFGDGSRPDAEKDRVTAASSTTPASTSKEAAPANADQAGANRTGTGTAPHHHHHHHHHVHNHPTQTPTASTTGTNGAPTTSATPASAANPASSSAVRPPPKSTGGTGFLSARWGAGYPFFNARETDRVGERSFSDSQKEREARALREREREIERREKERERARELEAERERRRKAEAQTSPKVGQTGSRPGYFMPSLPPSPTVSRSVPAANTSQPGSANRTAASPQTTPSTAGSRPNLPLPGISSLGNRSLPSPFDRDRAPSTSSADAPGQPNHHRTLSSSSNKDRLTAGLTSPGKPATDAKDWRGYGAGDANRRPGEPERSPMTSPSATTKAPASATSTGAAGAGAGPNRHFSTYSYSAPFLGFGGSNYGSFSSSWLDRERQRQREREVRERELREQERRRELEREKLNKERLEREEQQRKAGGLDTRPFASRSSALYGNDYRGQFERLGQSSASNQSRIEVLNTPNSDQASAQPHTASTLNQVAPNREPRPYTYAGKNEPGTASAASAKEREYHYTPRDKKSRMDAAMEEQAHRRGSSTKKRRTDERPRSPHSKPIPYLANLTREVKAYPEVTSSQIETWLKTLPDLTAVRSRHVYGGNGWSLAGNLPDNAQLGDLMIVRINNAFLGESWILRGEDGWDTARPFPTGYVEVAEGWTDRNVFGTDVYTDDSDLGLVLLHAGWLKWKGKDPMSMTLSSETDADSKNSDHGQDYLLVNVRLVPRLVRYFGTERNGFASRGWGNGHDGLSIVVEGVQRQSAATKIGNARVTRKMRMAEMAQLRAIAFGPPRPIVGDEKGVNDLLPGVVFINNRPLFPYSPDEFGEYVHERPEECHTIRTLWRHRLYLESEDDVYVVRLDYDGSRKGAPKINVYHREEQHHQPRLRSEDTSWKLIASDRSPEDLSWEADGLLVRLKGDDGVFCAVKGYRWARGPEAGYD